MGAADLIFFVSKCFCFPKCLRSVDNGNHAFTRALTSSFSSADVWAPIANRVAIASRGLVADTCLSVIFDNETALFHGYGSLSLNLGLLV